MNGLERSILVVDDEPLIRINLADFFEDQGFRVFEAENADAAIAILEAHRSIRIVLTDVQMPGSMDGLKLAHFVRDRFPPPFSSSPRVRFACRTAICPRGPCSSPSRSIPTTCSRKSNAWFDATTRRGRGAASRDTLEIDAK